MKTVSKRVLSILLALMLVFPISLLAFGADDEREQIGDVIWRYTVSNNEATVTFAENIRGDVTVPSTLGGYPVVALADKCFYGNTTIGYLTLPEGIRAVGSQALDNSMKGVYIPASLTSLGSITYSPNYEFFEVAQGNTAYASDDGVLYTANMETLLRYPPRRVSADSNNGMYYVYYHNQLHEFTDFSEIAAQFGADWNDRLATSRGRNHYTIPEGVKTIASKAFDYGTYTLDVILPESLETIQSNAFADGGGWITPMRIPAGVTSIALDAFSRYSVLGLPAFNVDPANPNYCDIDGVLYTKDRTTLIKAPTDYLLNLDDEYRYDVPEGTTRIASYGLRLRNVQLLTFPASLTNIGTGNLDGSDYWTVFGCYKNTFMHERLKASGSHFVVLDGDENDPHGPYREGDFIYLVQNGIATLVENRWILSGERAEFPTTLGGYPMEIIGPSAFTGISTPHSRFQAKVVIIPEGVKHIRDHSFSTLTSISKNCDIYLPDSLESVGRYFLDSRYAGTVHCYSNSFIHQWLYENGYEHELVDTDEDDLCKYGIPHAPVPKSLALSEQYSFANAYANFTNNEYFTTAEDFLLLRDYTRSLYREQSAYPVLNALQNMRYSAWRGSCYGISVTALLNKTGQLDFTGNFAPGAASLSAVGKPKDNPAAESAINYYQISQGIPFLRSDYFGSFCGGGTNLPQGLEAAVRMAQAGKIMLFNYWFGLSGHSIVVHGYEPGPNGGHNLLAWDSRFPGQDTIVYVSPNFARGIVNGDEVIWGVEAETSFNRFDSIDITGPGPFSQTAVEKQLDSAILGFTPTADFTVASEDGQTLSFNSEDGTLEGGLDANLSFVTNSTPDGDPAPATFLFDVTDGTAYTFTSEGALDASMLSEEIYAAAKSDTAEAITIDPNGSIVVQGDGEVDFEASIGVNNDLMDMVTAKGTTQNEALICLFGDGVLVESEAAEVALTIFTNGIDTTEIEVANDYGNLLVTSNNNGDITVKASTDGETFDLDLLHECKFGEWSEFLAPTCGEDGEERRCCLDEDCDEYESRPIDALGHDYRPTVTQPTCTEAGFTTYNCSRCDASYTADAVDALGHDWDEWITVTPATEGEEGLARRDCKRGDCDGFETKVIPTKEHEHDFVSTVTAPTCTAKGFTTYTCRCGESYTEDEVDALGHDWDEWITVTPATEDEEGLARRDCKRGDCDGFETKVIPTKDHEHDFVPTVTAPTCTAKGFTTYTCRCGETYFEDEVDALGHDWGEWITVTPATEDAEGLKRRVCARDASHIEEEILPKLPHVHNYTAVVTAPTCTVAGITTYTCAKCGDKYTLNPTAATGHNWGDWTVTKSPTTTAGGTRTRSCTNIGCSETQSESIAKLEWWQPLPTWLQWLLRWFFFGWVWM